MNNKSGTCSAENSLNDLLYPPDAVFLNYSDAELDMNCALETEQENDAISDAQLICFDLLHNSDNTIKFTPRTCVKKDILNKGHPKISRGNPRAISSIDVELCDVKLKIGFEPITLLLSDASMGWAESDTDSDIEYSSDSDSSSDGSQTRKRRKHRRARKPPKPPRESPRESPRNSAADRPCRVQWHHNYEHARPRIRNRIPKLSDIDTAIYLFL